MTIDDFPEGSELDPSLLRDPDDSTTKVIETKVAELLAEELTVEDTIHYAATRINEVKSGDKIANMLLIQKVDDGVTTHYYFGIGNRESYEPAYGFGEPLLGLTAGDDKFWLEIDSGLSKQAALDMLDAMTGMFSNQRWGVLIGSLRNQLRPASIVDEFGAPFSLIVLDLLTERYTVKHTIDELLKQEDIIPKTQTIVSRGRNISTPSGGVYITQNTRPKQPGYRYINVTIDTVLGDSALKGNRLRFWLERNESEVSGYQISVAPLRAMSKKNLAQFVEGFEYTDEQFMADSGHDVSFPESLGLEASSPTEYKARLVLEQLNNLINRAD